MRARFNVVVVWLCLGCAGARVSPAIDAGETPAPDVARTDVAHDVATRLDVRDDAPTDDAAIDASATDGSGADVATRTVLRVRHGLGMRPIALRGDAPGLLTWTRGVSLRRIDDTLSEWSSDAVRAPFAWKPLADDTTWSLGPNFTARPGETTEVWARFTREAGVAQRWRADFRSVALANVRGVWVYLPPSYEEHPTRRYPVVYMHDGQNLFEPGAAFGGQAWEADDAMNLGASDGSMREAIVVGVENTQARIDEYTPSADPEVMRGGRAAQYLTLLVDELMPEVNRAFRTLTGPAHTALVGSSLGGLVSLWIGLRRADVFGAVGAMSPSTWWDGRMILREVAAARGTRMLRVWVDSGDSGPSRDGVDDTRMLADALRTAGYREGESLRYVVQPGASHNEAAWRSRLPDALRFLLGPRAF
ncbi:MAG: alpha/beta hydrolase-fold protein [Polyangiales bacterium]